MATAAQEMSIGIIRDPTRENEPILAGTSTRVRAIAALWNQGINSEEIPTRLPHLSLSQVFEALHFYLGHREEIDRFIEANDIPDELSGTFFDIRAQLGR